MSQSAFSQARLKIKPEVFHALNQECVNHFYSTYPVKKWNSFRLIAIDGSEVMLPMNKETVEEYGEYTTNFMNKRIVLARLSKAYDVLNNITIDAKLVNISKGEHVLANDHLKVLSPGDLVLFDRGYPSFDLFKNTLERGCHFCARIPVPNWRVAKRMVGSKEREIITEIGPGHELVRKYKCLNISFQPLQLRFIRIKSSKAEDVVLITSLLDSKKYPYELFRELYHFRWEIEESYKTDKHRLQLENFSGKSCIAIQQDFLAKIVLANISSILSSGLEPEPNKKPRKYYYKVNVTNALAKVKEALVLLFIKADIVVWIEKLYAILAKNKLPVRPNRSYKRVQRKKTRYYRTYLAL